MEYLAILLFFLLISLYIDWKYNIHLYTSRRERIVIPLAFFVIGFIWDSFGVYRGHWSFNSDKLLKISLGPLPIEEYLFFIIVPYTILTIYRFLKREI